MNEENKPQDQQDDVEVKYPDFDQQEDFCQCGSAPGK